MKLKIKFFYYNYFINLIKEYIENGTINFKIKIINQLIIKNKLIKER